MADDIVARQRAGTGDGLRAHDWMNEAADRIEKLEAALRFYACDCKPECKCGLEYYSGVTYCGHTARKALEEKDG